METCVQHYASYPLLDGVGYCNATFDNFICWPPTEAGSTVYEYCPDRQLSDPRKMAFRRCGLDSMWLGHNNEKSVKGWTNYTPCFPLEIRELLEKINKGDSQAKFQIVHYTRNMEIVGFTASLFALLISLFIFVHFRSLRNSRTKIHRNLFFAMTIQVIVRLVLYLDQAIMRESYGHKTLHGLGSMPYICEICYVFLEYGISAMFCWMFIEGLYLHSVVTANALRESITYNQYCILGWGLPVCITMIWAIVTSIHYIPKTLHCWYAYNFLPQYWVCQGPRLAIVITNLLFLLNILRVLVVKLNQSENSELEKLRKAVRAALVLLPLLGITNILNMMEAPLDGSVWKFAMWSYITHFLRSFQGLFIALIYCFLNGEVRQVLSRQYRDWSAMRNDRRRMRRAARASRRRMTKESQPTKPWNEFFAMDWVRRALNYESADADVDIEMGVDESERREMFSDRNAVDNLPTIRFDADTNVTECV